MLLEFFGSRAGRIITKICFPKNVFCHTWQNVSSTLAYFSTATTENKIEQTIRTKFSPTNCSSHKKLLWSYSHWLLFAYLRLSMPKLIAVDFFMGPSGPWKNLHLLWHCLGIFFCFLDLQFYVWSQFQRIKTSVGCQVDSEITEE